MNLFVELFNNPMLFSNINETYLKNALMINREDLTSDLGVRLPPLLRKIDFFIFETPDSEVYPDQQYSFITLFQKNVKRYPE